MKITIDTKEDSHEEIKKVIRMLSSLVGDHEIISNQGNLFENKETSETPQSDAFSNMFGDSSILKEDEEGTEKNEKKKDVFEVIEY